VRNDTMLAGAVAIRFILYGLVAVGLYTGYQYYHLTPGTSSLSPPSSHLHTSGSLGVGTMLPDGRASISRRTVAVADLHGDLQHALNVLSMASIISAPSSASIKGDGWEYEWVGGHDVLVSTGDIVDRGDDTIALYRLFMSLRKQAERSGGQVKNLLGNHEIMNAIGDWRYVTLAISRRLAECRSVAMPCRIRAGSETTGWTTTTSQPLSLSFPLITPIFPRATHRRR
jgi:hypothetical protein